MMTTTIGCRGPKPRARNHADNRQSSESSAEKKQKTRYTKTCSVRRNASYRSQKFWPARETVHDESVESLPRMGCRCDKTLPRHLPRERARGHPAPKSSAPPSKPCLRRQGRSSASSATTGQQDLNNGAENLWYCHLKFSDDAARRQSADRQTDRQTCRHYSHYSSPSRQQAPAIAPDAMARDDGHRPSGADTPRLDQPP